ncbi:MAG: DUF4177 domain-containing protein [Desulfofustis sp.]|nr:DUF4177 domain-containing protein [Desulfofustis sp.]
MMRWGYKTVHFAMKKEGLLGGVFLDETEIEQELNEFGKSGWELVSLLEMNDGLIAFFKQQLGGTAAAPRGDREAGDRLYRQDGGSAERDSPELTPSAVVPSPGAFSVDREYKAGRQESAQPDHNVIGAIKIE